MYRLKDQENNDSRSDEEPEQDQQTDSDTTERQDGTKMNRLDQVVQDH